MSLTTNQSTFSTAWSAPSNIALVKYWGKLPGDQIPANPSLSFTLEHSRTLTSMVASESNQFSVEYLFAGQAQPSFQQKVIKVIEKWAREEPKLLKYSYQFNSSNSFPHSAGIASSASSMAALSLCLLSLCQKWNDKLDQEEAFLKQASHWARLGSGSAARSLFPKLAWWGSCSQVTGTSDKEAINLSSRLHPSFQEMNDSIIIIDSGEKSVSSRAGHALMDQHPYRELRFATAEKRALSTLSFLETGNWSEFEKIVEIEALELHSLMMTSEPSFILMKPDTLRAIDLLRTFRAETGTQICFTLDAGPNLHILYPKSEEARVLDFINSQLKPFAKSIIHDQLGNGPRREKQNV